MDQPGQRVAGIAGLQRCRAGRAGLAEALTLLADTRAPDEAFDPLRLHFTEEQIANITVAISTINVWNRVTVGLRTLHAVAPETAAA